MSSVTSQDGTSIAYERTGSGPTVILVGGGLDDGSENAPIAQELAEHFTVYNYARRGRGSSGDTQPYAVQREVEDIEALIGAAGGSAHLFGVSSGGALSLEAAAAGLRIDKLAVYEVPYGWPPPGFVEQVEKFVADGRPGDAVALFMRSGGSTEADVAGARSLPFWPALEALAHTLAYDARCMAGGQVPVARFARVTRPTLVAVGGQRPDVREGMTGLAPDFFGRAADAIVAAVPNTRREILAGQGHVADPTVIAPVLQRFFG